jgi:phosphatidylglycerophosphatase A
MNVFRPLWVRALASRIVVKLATVFVGEKVVMPGTIGSFIGLFWYTLFFYGDNLLLFWIKLAASIYLAVVICEEAEFRLGKKDPPVVILDEVVAMPLCFVLSRALQVRFSLWVVLLSGFLVFRFFDIIKPLGIRSLQKFGGGVGIVIDDLVAAIYTAIILFIAGKLSS